MLSTCATFRLLLQLWTGSWQASYKNATILESVSMWRNSLCSQSLQAEYRHLRGKLGRAWDAIEGWQISRPLAHIKPITLQMLRFLFLKSLNLIFEQPHNAMYILRCVILCRGAFHGLMRLGEAIRLRSAEAKTTRCPNPLAIINNLNATLGRLKFSVIRDLATVRWLEWLVKLLSAHLKLWLGSLRIFRKWWNRVIGAAELQTLGLLSSSLRTVGSTHLYLSGVEIRRLQFLGRWTGLSSLRSYIQGHGQASMVGHSSL